jgi:hypothetical protein
VALLLSWRFARLFPRLFELRVDDLGESENVTLKFGVVQRKRRVNAQDFSHIAQRLLRVAVSFRSGGIHQISIERIQTAG